MLDTSGINHLVDDPNSDSRIAVLVSEFHVRLTYTNLLEIYGTRDPNRRRLLLRVCKRLLARGYLLEIEDEIMSRMVERFESAAVFDWHEVGVCFTDAERETALQEEVDDGDSGTQRKQSQDREKKFARVYADAKPNLNRLLASGDKPRPASPSEWVNRVQIEADVTHHAGNVRRIWVELGANCSGVCHLAKAGRWRHVAHRVRRAELFHGVSRQACP